MQRFLFSAVLVSALAAQAQGTTALAPLSINVAGSSATSVIFGADDCGSNLQLNWQSNLIFNTCSDLQLWATNGECGDDPVSGDKVYPSIPATQVFTVRSGSFTLKLSELPAFSSSDGGVVCGTQGVQKSMKICGAIDVQQAGVTTCTVQKVTTPLPITYDVLAPAMPVIESLRALDASLQAEVSVSSDTTLVHLQVRKSGESEFVEKGVASISGSGSVKATGLSNNSTYDVRAIAEDGAGNLSAPSEVLSGTPQHTAGFFEIYRRNGGMQGGCAAAGLAPLAIGSLLWALARRRKQK